MKTATYPELGSKVRYCRQNLADKSVEVGSGRVLGLGMDINKRLNAFIEPEYPEGTDKPSKFNVPLASLEPSDEYIERFKKAVEEIDALAVEGNGKAQAIVSEWNDKVSAVYETILGAPVEFE